MIGNKKRVLTQILGADPNENQGNESSPDYLKTCVSEFIDAVHAKDVEGAMNALKACLSEIDSQPEELGEG